MTETEFRRLAAAYGADVARWPDRARARAEVVAGEAWAAAILNEAAAFDDLLRPPQPAIEAHRVDRAIAGVNARIASEQAPAGRFAWMWRLADPLPGMAAAGLIGAVLGFSGVAWPAGGGDGLVGLLAAAMAYSDPSFFVMGG
jgi:hypothetical protein